MNVLDLPEEVLVIIFAFLGPGDLLAVCQTCRTLHANEFLVHSSVYWRSIAKSTFPKVQYHVAENDGKSWMNLFRRLSTQTKVYTWGNNDHGSLVGSQIRTRHLFHRHGLATFPPLVLPTLHPQRAHWPQRATRDSLEGVGVVADIQCGGWSTVTLNSKGKLHVNGIINGEQFLQMPSLKSAMLVFPDTADDATTIQQFSAGRSHILGLTDSGRIWTWDNHHLPGVRVRFLGVPHQENTQGFRNLRRGHVRKVLAGWNKSSALVVGTGIVIWDPVDNDALRRENVDHGPRDRNIAYEGARVEQAREAELDQAIGGDDVIDTALIGDHWTVAHTGYFKGLTSQGSSFDDVAYELGEVKTWTLLESFVLVLFTSGRLFASKLPGTNESAPTNIVEMTPVDCSKEELVSNLFGAFRSFGILKRNGEVLIGNMQQVEDRWNTTGNATSQSLDPLQYRIFPSLQHSGVISIAFGDHHFLALHSNGAVTSFGKDSQFCGALGLGGLGIDLLRGITAGPPNAPTVHPDGELLEQCYTTGRRVHFEDEKLAWLNHLRMGPKDRAETIERLRACASDHTIRAEVSEWVEKRLSTWEDAVLLDDENGRTEPSHFTVAVAAAGWHSAALLMVDRSKRRKVRALYKNPRSPDEEKESKNTPQTVKKAETTQDQREEVTEDPGRQRRRWQLNRVDVTMFLIYSIWRQLVRFFKWFVGYPLIMNAEDQASRRSEWIWESEKIPRLRLRNGSVMPGSSPLIDSQAPDWKQVEMKAW